MQLNVSHKNKISLQNALLFPFLAVLVPEVAFARITTYGFPAAASAESGLTAAVSFPQGTPSVTANE